LLRGAEWRSEQIGRIAADLAASRLGSRGTSAFKVKRHCEEADLLADELTALYERRALVDLSAQEAEEHEAVQQCARARAELVDALIRWIQADTLAGIAPTYSRKLSDHWRRVHALVECACHGATGSVPGEQDAGRVASVLAEFEQELSAALRRGLLDRAQASRLAIHARSLRYLVKLTVRCIEADTMRQPAATPVLADQRAA
jgi:hypothetical protein